MEQLKSCCRLAAQRFKCIFVQNTVSKKLHVLSDETSLCTRGCKWKFKDRPHEIIREITEDNLNDAARCEVCLPLQITSAPSTEPTSQIVPMSCGSGTERPMQFDMESCSSSDGGDAELLTL